MTSSQRVALLRSRLSPCRSCKLFVYLQVTLMAQLLVNYENKRRKSTIGLHSVVPSLSCMFFFFFIIIWARGRHRIEEDEGILQVFFPAFVHWALSLLPPCPTTPLPRSTPSRSPLPSPPTSPLPSSSPLPYPSPTSSGSHPLFRSLEYIGHRRNPWSKRNKKWKKIHMSPVRKAQ